jgi:hypothetical protein
MKPHNRTPHPGAEPQLYLRCGRDMCCVSRACLFVRCQDADLVACHSLLWQAHGPKKVRLLRAKVYQKKSEDLRIFTQ